ncbi:MAG: hypothetical protein VYC39_11780 [Myxococcota bacterium]|nr:hypothetical protein [Myxococcota bacterium]
MNFSRPNVLLVKISKRKKQNVDITFEFVMYLTSLVFQVEVERPSGTKVFREKKKERPKESGINP